MCKTVQIAIFTVVWLLANPTLHIPDSVWLEVGAPPAAAEAVKERPRQSDGSVVQVPSRMETVAEAAPVPGYLQVPTVPVLPRGSTGGAGLETVNDRIVRCTHQAALGGLPADQQGGYIHACAMR